ncbi:MAG: ribosome biogenesis GTPase Der [Myxococcota bacterium]
MNEKGNAVNRLDRSEGAMPEVALVGRANVGKSTLFNRLLRMRRALVEDRPGVTRDRVAVTCEIEGRPVRLVDTGGLDPRAKAGIPAAVAAQARRAVHSARVILLVVDAREGLLPLDSEIADELRRSASRVIVVANKADRPSLEIDAGEFHALGFETVVPVSAEHRRGIVDLEIEIAERLPPRGASTRDEGSAETDSGRAPTPRLAIIGRPNVGKSSLVNRLLGTEDAVVSSQPGTTRDATDRKLQVGGREVWLVDTAGLRRQGRREDRVERGSALYALRAIERCDVAILLLDAAEGVTDQDAKIARLALDCGRPLVLGLNKWDLLDPSEVARVSGQLERRLRFVRDPRVVRMSARTGLGTRRLLRAALEVHDSQRRQVATAELNRVIQQAMERNAPPSRGHRRGRLLYATQVSDRPFTVLCFVNDPELFSREYRRYLESRLREAFGLGVAPARVRLRRRTARDRDAAETR